MLGEIFRNLPWAAAGRHMRVGPDVLHLRFLSRKQSESPRLRVTVDFSWLCVEAAAVWDEDEKAEKETRGSLSLSPTSHRRGGSWPPSVPRKGLVPCPLSCPSFSVGGVTPLSPHP